MPVLGRHQAGVGSSWSSPVAGALRLHAVDLRSLIDAITGAACRQATLAWAELIRAAKDAGLGLEKVALGRGLDEEVGGAHSSHRWVARVVCRLYAGGIEGFEDGAQILRQRAWPEVAGFLVESFGHADADCDRAVSVWGCHGYRRFCLLSEVGRRRQEGPAAGSSRGSSRV